MTLVIGGARSGKSVLAERLVLESGRVPVYLATAEAHDDEMRARIAEHRRRRVGWQMVEAPRQLAGPLTAAAPGSAVLLDCATMWLSNVMLAGADIAAEEDRLMSALARCAAPVVVVTNEVGLSIVPENKLARAFRDAQGRLNQRLAAEAGLVVAVWAGLPLVLKGAMPAGAA
ncbi:MAG: bifunctional adenosylcobinamide kinase/adenosylcobinamide-phosphate guanylyltransferase [Gemmobacter sp.]